MALVYEGVKLLIFRNIKKCLALAQNNVYENLLLIQGLYGNYREKFWKNRFISDISTILQNSSKYILTTADTFLHMPFPQFKVYIVGGLRKLLLQASLTALRISSP